ncbi:hypothetical protein PM082_019691 [Marasmius tenuissimus]|nr:hypothetical protein PM082_019691 [Marasmius tenuissimus]
MTSTPVTDTRDRYLAEDQYKSGILQPLVVSSVHLFLYGLNVMLFRVALTLLNRRRREKRAGHRLFLFSLLILFVLSSLGVPISLVWDILATRAAFCVVAGLDCANQALVWQSNLETSRTVIILIMTLVIDLILVFRCFVICGWRQKQHGVAVTILCAILNVSGAIIGIWAFRLSLPFRINRSEILPHMVSILKHLSVAFVCSHLFINIILTSIISKTILWSGPRRELGTRTPRRFKTIARLMLESCILYLATWIVYIILGLYQHAITGTAGSVLIQVAAIAPTLLIVRANICSKDAEGDHSHHPILPFFIDASGKDELKEGVLDISRPHTTTRSSTRISNGQMNDRWSYES